MSKKDDAPASQEKMKKITIKVKDKEKPAEEKPAEDKKGHKK